MPRQSLLVSWGPLGMKWLPAERRAKTNENWLESQSNVTAKGATQAWLRTYRGFQRALRTNPPGPDHRRGQCIEWTAEMGQPGSWLRTPHVKAGVWTRTGNTCPLKEEKEKLRPKFIVFEKKNQHHAFRPKYLWKSKPSLCQGNLMPVRQRQHLHHLVYHQSRRKCSAGTAHPWRHCQTSSTGSPEAREIKERG